MSSRDRQIEALFHAALAKGTIGQQRAFLQEACGDDADLFEEVRTLLEAHNESDGVLDSPVLASDETCVLPPSDLTGSQIGPYRLLQKIGEGGMGIVYMAEQKEPIKRRVAVKVVKPGMDTRQVIARFDAERQALALMDHPNIAKVLDAGETEHGRSFFVMELVKGIPVTTYCDEHHLTVRERVELFIPICQAIQHAHQKGIIHRDLKPSNILIADYDHHAVPKVIDFGVAKALNQQLTENTVFTGFDQIIGTLEYMSPEQAKLNQLDVDTRSDIYALCAVLYELIAGVPPFESTSLRALALDEVLRVIREEDPPCPSTRLSSSGSLPALAAKRAAEPRKLTMLVRGELDWIVMKGLDKDRARRYDSANDVALDLRRYLNHEAISAYPPRALYRARKFIRRNRTWIAASLLVLIATVFGIGGTLSQHMVARTYYEREQDANSKLKVANGKLEVQIANVERQKEIASNHKSAAEQAVWNFYLLVSDSPELLGGLPGTQRLRKVLLKTARDYYAEFVRRADSAGLEYERAIASNRLALVEFDMGNVMAGIKAHEDSTRHWRKLVEQSPENAEFRAYFAGSLLGWAKAEYTAGKLDGAEQHASEAQQILQKLIDERPESSEHQRDMAWSHNVLGNVSLLRDHAAQAIEHYEQAIRISELMLQEDATDTAAASRLAGCAHNISAVLKELGRLDEAVVYSRRSVEIARQLLEQAPESEKQLYELASFETNLGVILTMQGNRDEALPLHRAAVEKYERVAELNPVIPDYREGLAKAHNSIGMIMEDFGKSKEAGQEFAKAIALREPMVEKHPDVPEYAKELIKNYGNLARIQLEEGERQAALDSINRSIALGEDLTARFADTPEYGRLLSRSYNQLGQYHFSNGDYTQAEENFQLALKIASKPAGGGGDDAALSETEVTGALRNLAALAMKQGDNAGAEDYYGRVIQRLKAGDQEDRTASDRMANLTLTYVNLAEVLNIQGRQPEAIAAYETAIGVAQQLYDNPAELPGTRGLLAATLCNLGLLHIHTGDHEHALARLSAAVQCAGTLAQQHPDSEKVQEYLQITRSNLALLYVNTQRFTEALACYEQVVSYDGPENQAIRAVKALAARQAAREYRRVGDLANAHDNLQLAVQLGQQLMNASPTPERTYEFMQACCALGSHLAWAKEPDKARTAFQRGINAGEQLVTAHPTVARRLDLANLYDQAGSLESSAFESPTAQDFYARAIELLEQLRSDVPDASGCESTLVKLYVNLGNCLVDAPAERLDALGKAISTGQDLIARFPEDVAYRDSLMSAYLNRAITFDSLGKTLESRDDYGAAIEVSRVDSADVAGQDRLARIRVPALVNLGLIYRKLKQTEEAVRCNREAIEVGARLAAQDPTQTRMRIDVAGAQVNLASILHGPDEQQEALELLQSARGTLAELLSSAEWSGYARGFLQNSLATERRCYAAILKQPPADSDLEWVQAALTSSIDWSEEHLKRWPTDHANYPLLANHLAQVRDARAQICATDPRDTVRKGVEAVADAARACELTSYQVWQCIETLAAAYAEVGSFPEAVERQRQAIEMAPEERKEQMQQRLELYLHNQAFRRAWEQPTADTTSGAAGKPEKAVQGPAGPTIR